MLPITQHRVFHIPHSLATIAAIAAVITALNWSAADEAGMGGELQATKDTATLPTGQAEADLPDADDSKPAREAASVECRYCAGSGLSGLLPLVLPGAPSR